LEEITLSDLDEARNIIKSDITNIPYEYVQWFEMAQDKLNYEL
jgi:hypothetical protein